MPVPIGKSCRARLVVLFGNVNERFSAPYKPCAIRKVAVIGFRSGCAHSLFSGERLRIALLGRHRGWGDRGDCDDAVSFKGHGNRQRWRRR